MARRAIFIDASVVDHLDIVSTLPEGAEWHLIGAAEDGLARMAQLLAGRSDLQAIDIVSHGAPGMLRLGAASLTLESITERLPLLQQIGQSLAEGGDLLLYGCDAGAGDAGRAFIGALAAATGADVAASDDTTGLGGDWRLEASIGPIEAAAIEAAGYGHRLAADFASGGGIVTTAIGSGSEEIRSIVVQPDGKILVAGFGSNGSNNDFALARYNSDGSLDTTFDGDGKLLTAVGSSNDSSYGLALQPDGKILVSGHSLNGSKWDVSLARYNSDGSLDTSFDGDGRLLTAVGSSTDSSYGLALQPDGKILVAGASWNGSNFDFALVRYNSNGSLDTSFDGDGKLTTAIGSGDDVGYGLALQPDGRILVAGRSSNGSNNDFALVRYNSNGSLDTSFDGDGKLVTAIGSGDDVGYGLALQPDGRILVAGTSSNGSNNDFALVRYNSNGSLDTSFDGDGKLVTAIGSGNDAGYGLALQPDGRILVAGASRNGSNNDIALVRYNSNGSLDTSFDGDGKLTTAIGSGDDAGFSLALQPDGRILVAGTSSNGSNNDFALVRYNSDGSLAGYAPPPAVGFASGGGRVTTAIGPGNDEVRSVLVQPDGKILVAGTSTNGSNNDIALARYNADGSLDTAFDGDGKLTTAIGSGDDYGFSLALQPDGRILVAGRSSNGSNNDFALVRYNSNGSLDTSFDGDGKLVTAVGSGDDHGYGLVLQPDGKILVSGYSHNGTNLDFALVRYNSNGSLDTSFDGDGKLLTAMGSSTDGSFSLVLQPDGRILVAGYSYNGSNYDFALARYNSNGSLDTSFDGDGKLTTAIGSGDEDARSVILQPDGKILVAGASRNGGNEDVALVRYNSNGSLDTSFDGDGKLTTAIGSGDDYSFSLALQPDGRILVAGRSWNGSNNDFAIVRYNSNGSLDTSFDGDGKLTTAIGSGDDRSYSLAIQPDGKIVVAGASWNGSNDDFAIVRYNSDGSLDSSTGGSGNVVQGTAGNDRLAGTAGNDSLDGGPGIDTAVYLSARSGYTVTVTVSASAITVAGTSDGTDQLTSVERLHFSDRKLAFDLAPSGNAGQAVEFIGMLAPGTLTNPQIVGMILGYFDAGTSMTALCQLAIDAGLVTQLAGSAGNADLARLVFRNVIGSAADAATVDALVAYMDGRSDDMTQAQFMAAVAGLEVNQAHVNLVGLQSTGIEYL